VVPSGGPIHVTIDVANRAGPLPESVEVWFQVRSLQSGTVVFGSSPGTLGMELPREGDFRLRASMQLNVPAGSYSVEGHVWDRLAMREIHFGAPKLVQVQGGPSFFGSVQMNATLEVLPTVDA